MRSSSPPPPPDPRVVAEAQTKSNRETAIANANLNRFNQYGPQGSIEYDIVGTNPDGTPRYQQRTSYSPGEQMVYDRDLQTRQNIGQIGVDQSSRIGQLLGTPVNLNNEAVEARLFGLGRSRLDPMFSEERARLDQRLANQGIGVGSAPWTMANRSFDERQNDAYNSLLLSGRKQAVQEALTERNQPINEISALSSGSQVSQPQFAGFQPVAQANTDIGGIYNQGYANQLNAWRGQQEGSNNMMGGLFGLGSAALRFMPWSDKALKINIRYTGGKNRRGIPIARWNYVWGGPEYEGFIAQDVEKIAPEAVVTVYGGLKAVDYEKAA